MIPFSKSLEDLMRSQLGRRVRMPPFAIALLLLGFPFAATSAAAQTSDPLEGEIDSGDDFGLEADGTDFIEMSLEELMNIDVEVTSVSRKSESLADTAAAVYVITAEDIRRSGALSIPEALRLAPGMHVARLTNDEYAISARGFSTEFANKMLVLIDGRSVYTPLFSGVRWGLQDVAIEDIERIEVIRGPGGTIWGANAVNGVVNIITKPADSVQGGRIRVLAGTEEKFTGTLRTGGAIGEYGHLRAYVKSRERRGLQTPESIGINGRSQADRGGFRADWDLEDGNTFRLQGDMYRLGQRRGIEFAVPEFPFLIREPDEREFEGGNVLGSWSHVAEDGTVDTLESYYVRNELAQRLLAEKRDTFDIQYRRQQTLNDSNDLIWGLRYRVNRSETVGTSTLSFGPPDRTDHLFSAFVQDEYQATEHLKLIAGSKIEHNDYTGVEIQPSLRFAYSPRERDTYWGAISRAVRTPSRVDVELHLLQRVIPGVPPGFNTEVAFTGNADSESEELIAFELGARTHPTETTSLDIAAFVHDYDNLQSVQLGTATPTGPSTIRQPIFLGHASKARSYGVEVAGQMVLSDRWTLHSGYSLLLLDVDTNGSGADTGTLGAEETAPRNQFHIRSFFDLTEKTELDVSLYYVDNLSMAVDSYVRGDVRVGWSPSPGLSVSGVVQGLFHDDEQEFTGSQFGEYYGAETSAYLVFGLSF